MLFCGVVAKHALLDIPRELEVACYTALPVACIQAKSMDVLKDIYELDLQRYVSWHRQSASQFSDEDLENAVTFFRWMELKVRFEANDKITSDK